MRVSLDEIEWNVVLTDSFATFSSRCEESRIFMLPEPVQMKTAQFTATSYHGSHGPSLTYFAPITEGLLRKNQLKSKNIKNISSTTLFSTECPKPTSEYITRGNRHFKVITDYKFFRQAEDLCISDYGGEVVRFRDPHQWSLLMEVIKGSEIFLK